MQRLCQMSNSVQAHAFSTRESFVVPQLLSLHGKVCVPCCATPTREHWCSPAPLPCSLAQRRASRSLALHWQPVRSPGAASCLNRLSPVWVLPPSWCACHTLWNLVSSFQHPPWPALTSTSVVVCFQGLPMVKNLTVSSTWTPTAAMPSAFYWPLLVPCAPAGLRRQLTSSLGPV